MNEHGKSMISLRYGLRKAVGAAFLDDFISLCGLFN
jgi:hypothetical protein